MDTRRFTKTELEQYNGAYGVPVFVACRGIVYDLSHSFLWKSGKHQALHRAGRDLTASITQAPHDADLLAKFPVVGILVEDLI